MNVGVYCEGERGRNGEAANASRGVAFGAGGAGLLHWVLGLLVALTAPSAKAKRSSRISPMKSNGGRYPS